VLEQVGLRRNEPVRFRHDGAGRWVSARIAGLDPDGSIVVRDATRGAARAVRPHHAEVRRPGSRGRLTWQNVGIVAITWEQLSLW
jgi:hypothetical protein